jgi:hypothetical protein
MRTARQDSLTGTSRQGTLSEIRIGESARRRQVADEDIRHDEDIRNHIRKFDTDEVTMSIGPARNGAFLEVGVLDFDADPVIIHAMPLRPGFHRFL